MDVLSPFVRSFIAIMSVAMVLSSPACVAANGEYPVQLQRMFEFAERDTFDGRFKEAAEHVAEARKWIMQPQNQQDLAAEGFQWSAVKANTEAFDAWIEAEKGNEARAHVLFKKALDALKRLNLRLWAALVHIQAGDFEFAHAFPAVSVADSPKAVQDRLAKREFRLKAARTHYEKAGDVILGMAEGSNFAKRLKGRNEHALARCAMAAGELAAAERHLQESERMFRAMPHFDVFIAPGVQWPKSLKQVKKDLDANKDLKPADKHWYISEYSRTIVEWLRLHADQAELVVRQAVKEGGDWTQQHADAEKFFRKAGDLCDVNLRRDHPFRFRSDVSRGVYYIRRAEEMRELAAAAPPGPEKDKLVAAERSFFLDAAFSAQDALAEMQQGGTLLGSHPLRLEALLLELTAHDAGFPIAGRKRDAIIADMNEWVACQTGKPKAD